MTSFLCQRLQPENFFAENRSLQMMSRSSPTPRSLPIAAVIATEPIGFGPWIPVKNFHRTLGKKFLFDHIKKLVTINLGGFEVTFTSDKMWFRIISDVQNF